jgi:hypothetical protein
MNVFKNQGFKINNQVFKVPGFRGFQKSRFQRIEVSRFQGFDVLRFIGI